MANITNISSTYAGEAKQGIIANALLEASTIKGGHISVLSGIKYKEVLRKMSATGLIQDYSCTDAEDGTLTMGEAVLEPAKFMINKKECVDTFRPYWSGNQPAGVWNSGINEADAIVDYYIKSANIAVEKELWVGTGAVITGLSGLTVLAANDVNTIKVTGTTLSKTNIIAELEKVYNAIPAEILTDPELRIAISPKAMGFYLQAMNALGNATNGGLLTENSFYGIRLFTATGLAGTGDNKMLAYSKNNVYFGTDLLGDHTMVNVVDLRSINQEYISFKLVATAGWVYVHSAEVVLYA